MSLIEECYASGRGELVDTIEARKEGAPYPTCTAPVGRTACAPPRTAGR